MYGAAAEADAGNPERTAFRQAEKRYKLYKTPAPKHRKKQAQNLMDLSDVVDFHVILDSFDRSGETPPGIFRFYCPGFHLPVFCFTDRPGVPRIFTDDENADISELLTHYFQTQMEAVG